MKLFIPNIETHNTTKTTTTKRVSLKKKDTEVVKTEMTKTTSVSNKKVSLKKKTPKKTVVEVEVDKTPEVPKEVISTLYSNSNKGYEYDLPFFITTTDYKTHGTRYLLILKRNLACITAQDSLEKVLDAVTAMTDRHGHSLSGLRSYLDNADTVVEYPLEPVPTIKVQRKSEINNTYDEMLMTAIRVSENKKSSNNGKTSLKKRVN